jgi:hypothetical protein
MKATELYCFVKFAATNSIPNLVTDIEVLKILIRLFLHFYVYQECTKLAKKIEEHPKIVEVAVSLCLSLSSNFLKL